ncbi:MAG: [acyl-carrier-protein] S-malonyltransferase, partial [Candidatus Cryptobacteroides sp.]
MKTYGFPGQGSQYPGMGRENYECNALARELFDKADAILGFSLTDIMFNGSAETCF